MFLAEDQAFDPFLRLPRLLRSELIGASLVSLTRDPWTNSSLLFFMCPTVSCRAVDPCVDVIRTTPGSSRHQHKVDVFAKGLQAKCPGGWVLGGVLNPDGIWGGGFDSLLTNWPRTG